MKLLKGFQADRLISQIGTLDRSSPDAKKVAEKLSQLGPAAIPPLLEALELADRNQTPIYVDLLAKLLDARTLPYFTDALSSTSSRVGWPRPSADSSVPVCGEPSVMRFFTAPSPPASET